MPGTAAGSQKAREAKAQLRARRASSRGGAGLQAPASPDDLQALERRRVRDGILLEDGQRLGDVMDPWQREDFEALDDPQYRHAYLERPRGHSKTGDIATEAVVELLAGAPSQRLYAFAADEDQARILFDDVRGKLERGGHVAQGKGPLKAGWVRVLKNTIASWTGSVLKVMPADVPGSWGLRPDWMAADELVEWRHEALWQSIWSASGKRPRCRVLVISTAGWDQSHFSWNVRKIAESESDWHFSSRGQCASWIDPAWLAQQERTLPPHVFQRLHQNRWVDGVGAFLTADEVNAIFTDDLPATAGARISVGLDVGLTKDKSVLAPVAETKDKLLVVLGLETWAGSKGQKVDLREVEDMTYEVSKRSSAPIYVDPWQATLMGQNLQRRGRRVVEYPITSESRRRLFGYVLSTIRDRRLRCRPHEELRRELLGLEVKETLAGYRVDHKPGRHDDHVFAIALALAGLLEGGERFTPWVSSYTQTTAERAQAYYEQRQRGRLTTGRDQADEYRRHLIRCQDPRSCGNHPAHAAPPPAAPAPEPPQVIDDAKGTQWVSTPTGGREVYRDPRGLEPGAGDPYMQCKTCGAQYPKSFDGQHRMASPRCSKLP